MSKCMFQGCDREAAIHFPCIYDDLYNFHYFYVCRQEPVSMEIKEKRDDH